MKYFNKLSSEQIIEFLNKNGLFVLDNIDEQMLHIEEDQNSIYLRCMNVHSRADDVMLEFKNKISAKFPILSKYINRYDSCINLYELDDFMICRALFEGEYNQVDIELQRSYHNMMIEFFADSDYEKDYNQYVDSLNDNKISNFDERTF